MLDDILAAVEESTTNEIDETYGETTPSIEKQYRDYIHARAQEIALDPNFDLDAVDTRFSGALNLGVLKNKRVCVIGVGGIGHPLVRVLAGMGVTDLTVIDDDTVETHNVGPQGYDLLDVGRTKVEVVAERLLRFRAMSITAIPERVTSYEHLVELLNGAPDILIPAVDNIAIRNTLYLGMYELVKQQNSQNAIKLPEMYIDPRMSLGQWNCFAIPMRELSKPAVGGWYGDDLSNDQLTILRKRSKSFSKLFRIANAHFQEAAVFEPSEAQGDDCTTRSISYTGANIASYIAALLHYLNNEHITGPQRVAYFMELIDALPEGMDPTRNHMSWMQIFNSREWVMSPRRPSNRNPWREYANDLADQLKSFEPMLEMTRKLSTPITNMVRQTNEDDGVRLRRGDQIYLFHPDASHSGDTPLPITQHSFYGEETLVSSYKPLNTSTLQQAIVPSYRQAFGDVGIINKRSTNVDLRDVLYNPGTRVRPSVDLLQFMRLDLDVARKLPYVDLPATLRGTTYSSEVEQAARVVEFHHKLQNLFGGVTSQEVGMPALVAASEPRLNIVYCLSNTLTREQYLYGARAGKLKPVSIRHNYDECLIINANDLVLSREPNLLYEDKHGTDKPSPMINTLFFTPGAVIDITTFYSAKRDIASAWEQYMYQSALAFPNPTSDYGNTPPYAELFLRNMVVRGLRRIYPNSSNCTPTADPAMLYAVRLDIETTLSMLVSRGLVDDIFDWAQLAEHPYRSLPVSIPIDQDTAEYHELIRNMDVRHAQETRFHALDEVELLVGSIGGGRPVLTAESETTSEAEVEAEATPEAEDVAQNFDLNIVKYLYDWDDREVTKQSVITYAMGRDMVNSHYPNSLDVLLDVRADCANNRALILKFTFGTRQPFGLVLVAEPGENPLTLDNLEGSDYQVFRMHLSQEYWDRLDTLLAEVEAMPNTQPVLYEVRV